MITLSIFTFILRPEMKNEKGDPSIQNKIFEQITHVPDVIYFSHNENKFHLDVGYRLLKFTAEIILCACLNQAIYCIGGGGGVTFKIWDHVKN